MEKIMHTGFKGAPVDDKALFKFQKIMYLVFAFNVAVTIAIIIFIAIFYGAL